MIEDEERLNVFSIFILFKEMNLGQLVLEVGGLDAFCVFNSKSLRKKGGELKIKLVLMLLEFEAEWPQTQLPT
jgi:hypothetical protein